VTAESLNRPLHTFYSTRTEERGQSLLRSSSTGPPSWSTRQMRNVGAQTRSHQYKPCPDRTPVTYPQSLFTITMLAVSLALTSLLLFPLARTSPLDGRWSDTDQYHGKKLTPSNYTVIPNIFIQDSPTFNATGYNLLNDSFGLIDKSAGRWQNFTKWVSLYSQGLVLMGLGLAMLSS